MPWMCNVCRQESPNGPYCYNLPECKKKGQFACTFVAAPAPAIVRTEPQQAAHLGYSTRVDTRGKKFPNGHSTSFVYVNGSGDRAISLDGSTHTGGRQSWKGFDVNGGGYRYAGTFQWDLSAWDFRTSDQYPNGFPNG